MASMKSFGPVNIFCALVYSLWKICMKNIHFTVVRRGDKSHLMILFLKLIQNWTFWYLLDIKWSNININEFFWNNSWLFLWFKDLDVALISHILINLGTNRDLFEQLRLIPVYHLVCYQLFSMWKKIPRVQSFLFTWKVLSSLPLLTQPLCSVLKASSLEENHGRGKKPVTSSRKSKKKKLRFWRTKKKEVPWN